jgi:phosphatidylinositol-3-phosphatase
MPPELHGVTYDAADMRSQSRALILAVLLLALLAAACGSSQSSGAGAGPSTSASLNPSPAPSPPAIAHIFIIVMENKAASEIIGNPDAPFLNGLAAEYALAADYSGLFHPSLPNYIALTSGSNQGISDNRLPTADTVVDAPNVADRIEASGRTWKLYAESIPSPGYSSNAGLYAPKHVPFLYYNDIYEDDARRTSHIVPFDELTADLKSASTTPDYGFITPNLISDMHDGSIAEGDAWLSRTVPVILQSPAFTTSKSLLVVTFDEGSDTDQHIVTILAGTGARQGYRSSRPYDHYSLLHTIEALWGLAPFTGNDAGAATMGELLRQ